MPNPANRVHGNYSRSSVAQCEFCDALGLLVGNIQKYAQMAKSGQPPLPIEVVPRFDLLKLWIN